MYNIASKQTEEIGKMRIQNISIGFQKSLTKAENTLNQISSGINELISQNASEEEIRKFLSEQKNIVYRSNELCLNVFCVIDGDVLISDMSEPDNYVLQDRMWYRGLLSKKKGEIYISPTYADAFTDNMCFTVTKMLDNGSIVGVDYSVLEIQSYVAEMSSDGYGDAMIIDENETIVGYTDPNMIGKKLSSELPQYRNAFLRAVASNDDNFSIREGGATEQKSTIFCSRTENGWYMICSVNNQELYKENYLQLFRNFIMSIMFVIVIVGYYFLGRNRKNIIYKNKELPLETDESSILQNKDMKQKKEQVNLIIKQQKKFQIIITVIFILTMIIVIFCTTSMTINESRIKMEEELRGYNYEIGDWVLEQKSILDMFENVIKAKPDLLENYDEMVKFLDDITRHYPKISATYIANPNFAHGHPMVMNNGWVPEEDYVEEERIWYTKALVAEDFNITEPYYDARTGEYCVTFSKAVESDKGEFYGVFAIDFYLNELTSILGDGYSEGSYAFLVDKNGLIIDHPNSEYKFSDKTSINIHNLVYDKLYSKSGMVMLRDYDNKYKVCLSQDEVVSDFRIIVVKDWWSIYGNVLKYTSLFLFLFGICILLINIIISKMIKW